MSETVAKEYSPKTTPFLVGHQKAAGLFLKAYDNGRLHHAWLLAGPQGIGKATLAYHLARFLLKARETSSGLFKDNSDATASRLEMAPDDSVFVHVAAGAEGNLRVIERGFDEKTKRRRSEIVIKDIRALHDFFELTAAGEGWRVAIVDPAEEMNRASANALLKMLEEPPAKTILFLITHAKGRLPATIRSRCQHMLLAPLKEGEVVEVLRRLKPDLGEKEAKKYAALSSGAPGLGLRLAEFGGEGLFKTIRAVFEGPGLSTRQGHDFCGALALAANEDKYFLFLDILTREIAHNIKRLARENAAKSRLDCWLELWEKVDRIRAEGGGLNLGRKQMLLVLLDAMAAAGENDRKAA